MPPWADAVVLNAVALACCTLLLGLHRRTWVDDDPCMVEAAASASWPWQFFLDQSKLAYGASNALTPFQMVSLWADHAAFGLTPLPFYVHHALSLGLCLTLVWLAARALTGDRLLALLSGLVWLFSSATLSVASFLSARHYVEGLALSLAAVLLCWGLPSRPWGRAHVTRVALGAVAATAACLHKEIFVALLAPLALAFAARHSRRLLALVLVAGMGYLAYRTWALGLTPVYGMPLLPPADALRGLAQWPRALDTRELGYVVAAMAAALPFALAARKRWLGAALVAIALAGQVAALYPVAYALRAGALAEPGTWSRVSLVPLTLAVLFAARLLVELRVPPALRRGAFAVLAALVVAQSGTTAAAWQRIDRHHAAELGFLLDATPGVLVSTVPAGWYPECVSRLHGVARERFAFPGEAPALCRKAPVAWVWDGRELRSFDPCQ